MIQQIAKDIGVRFEQVEACIRLIDEGNTIPFIARYRKEMTGDIGDEALRKLNTRLTYLRNLEQRKQEVIQAIEEQGKLTDHLRIAIKEANVLQKVEDLYRPFKQKKSTRASKAKALGLEPLADILWAQKNVDLSAIYASMALDTPMDEALKGAVDIMAERISDDTKAREKLRAHLARYGELISSKKENVDAKEKDVYDMYADYSERIATIPNHRVLALNRGEKTGYLKVKMTVDREQQLVILNKLFITNPSFQYIHYVVHAIEDAYARLLFPSLEREQRSKLTERAEAQAIEIFGKNTKSLLMTPPVRSSVVLAIDPGYRTGCKVAVLDPNGTLCAHTTIYPHPPQSQLSQAKKILYQWIETYGVQLISIGNGTASRETEQMVASVISSMPSVHYCIVSESGASVYSASELASKEYPDLDVSVRGAISIGRRLQDPLAELVKMDPKSIGVGQYQHDVNQKLLGEKLQFVVEDCVNSVGVDLNTATPSLLHYVSGINMTVANNIVKKREELGGFQNRTQLLSVPRLGEKAYEQAAGFLRIRDGKEPLDNTAVHPESYEAARMILKEVGASVDAHANIKINQTFHSEELASLAEQTSVGVLTLRDILLELQKPGRDPRDQNIQPVFRKDVLSMDDLQQGMVLQGTVRNVVDFGAFVDIGVKQDGLVHISKLSRSYVKHPMEVVSIGDQVQVQVVDIDKIRGKISLSMLMEKE